MYGANIVPRQKVSRCTLDFLVTFCWNWVNHSDLNRVIIYGTLLRLHLVLKSEAIDMVTFILESYSMKQLKMLFTPKFSKVALMRVLDK